MFTASNQSLFVSKLVSFYEAGGREGGMGVAVCGSGVTKEIFLLENPLQRDPQFLSLQVFPPSLVIIFFF